MNRKLLTLLLCSTLLLTSCGKSEVPTDSPKEAFTPPANFTDGFEFAEFDRFNSTAEENGLGDSLVYVTGTIGEIGVMTSNSSADFFDTTLTTPEGNQWLIFLDTNAFAKKEYFEDLAGHDVVLRGIYSGFALAVKMPVINMAAAFDTTTGATKYGIGEALLYESEDEATEAETEEAPKESASRPSKEPAVSPSKSEEPSSEAPVASVTTEQKNALKKGNSYLKVSAFSYQGLIDQLKFEGYSDDAATYAADNCGADWNEQAAQKAKSYLDIMAFSKSELIDQLKFEGFTTSQATYGAEANGF